MGIGGGGAAAEKKSTGERQEKRQAEKNIGDTGRAKERNKEKERNVLVRRTAKKKEGKIKRVGQKYNETEK